MKIQQYYKIIIYSGKKNQQCKFNLVALYYNNIQTQFTDYICI